MLGEIQQCKKERCKQTDFGQIKEGYKHHKKMHVMHTMEYGQLKKEVGYNSPKCDDSLSSEDVNNSDPE